MNTLPAGATRGHMLVEVASGDNLDVRQFSVHERISSLFHINVIAVSSSPNIDFEAVVGGPARLGIGVGAARTRVWTGVCSQLQQIGADERGLSTYDITIVPVIWLASQRRNHRIFQQMTEPDIVRKLLSEWGIEPAVRLSGSYKKRDYRVQYGESDFAFICRMLEDAGISFYFETESDESKLVLSDAPHSNDVREGSLPFRDCPTVADREHVTALHIGRRVRPGKYTVRDHDHRRAPSYQLLKSAAAPGGVEASLERFHYAPAAFLYESRSGESTPVADDRGKFRADEGEGTALVQRRLEAKRATARMFSFATNALDLAPGMVVRIVEHPRDEVDGGKFLILSSSLTGAHDAGWAQHCEASSAAAAYRPPLDTPRPKVNGVESATVVGPNGEEIHTDEFGRVRVHFHWDRESRMNEHSSCWIHVSHPWGGAGYGGVNLPRVGQEVIVDFLGGDPDRPIVVGRVYTGLQKVPYTLPAHKTQSGWKSSSTNGTGGYNEIMFEDAAGNELVRIQAERDLQRLVKHDESDTVGHDRTRLVKHDEHISVGNDRTESIGNDAAITIASNRTKQVGNNEDVAIGGSATEMIGVNRSIQVGVSHTESIGAEMHLSVGAAMTLSVGATKAESVGLASTESVGAMKTLSVGGAYVVTVGGAMASMSQSQSESVGTTKGVTVGDEYTLTCGASKISVDKAGNVVIEATNIKLKASGPVVVESDGNIKVQASGTVKVVGSSVKVN